MYGILHSLCVGVNEPLGLTTTWLRVVQDRYSLSLTTGMGEGGWILYCNGSVCTLAQSGAAFCSAKLQQTRPLCKLQTFGANPASLLHIVTFSYHLLTWKLWGRMAKDVRILSLTLAMSTIVKFEVVATVVGQSRRYKTDLSLRKSSASESLYLPFVALLAFCHLFA